MTSPPLPRVLVVDDEDIIRRTVARELRGAFEVVEADGLAQAVVELGRHEDLVAVVSDFDLGRGATGIQVLDEARRRRPAAARILTSGRAHPDDVAEHVRAGLVARFVQKPWTVGTLRDVLDDARRARDTMAPKVRPMKRRETAREDALPQDVRAGENEAAGSFAARYRPMLLAVIQQDYSVPSRDAEDVLQDVYRCFVPYLGRVNFPRALLKQIAQGVCAEYHRRQVAATRALQGFALQEAARRAGAPDVETRMLAGIDIARVLALSKGRCLELFTGVVLAGNTHTEYARQTGTPRGTIGNTLTRCIEKVRRLLCARGGEAAS